MAAAADEHQPLHILFFPYIAPGHLIPVADMAGLFASRGVKCTILTTPANAAVIRSAVDRANAALRRNNAVPAIDIATVPFPDVGLPPGVESVTGISSESDIYKLLDGSNRLREPLERFLAERRPDAVFADSFFPWAIDAASQHGVPRLSFLGTSMLARACTHALLRHNPAADGGDADVVTLPGLPHRVALRRSQLLDRDKHRFEWNYYELVDDADARSYGEVFNSFADLAPSCVEHYRAELGRRVWLVGPLAHARTDDNIAGAGRLSADDERCLRWLDGKPTGSVVYASFGTLTHFSPAERRELARGLQLSGKNFLWVMGGEEGTNASSQWMPDGFAELVAAEDQRGLIFRGWAPQTRILNHSAVGAFVTHCGWNSVLEAVSAGRGEAMCKCRCQLTPTTCSKIKGTSPFTTVNQANDPVELAC
ncbi:hypothetical protein EJB05_34915, partial [Eragrostis curvula]